MTEHHQSAKQRIEQQEAELRLTSVSAAGAVELGLELIESAPAPIAVRIQAGGRTLFASCHDDAAEDNERLALLKMRTSERFGHASLWWWHHLRTQDRTSARDIPWLDPEDYCHFGGSFPLRVGSLQVGAIGVSGLPHEDDHDLIVGRLGAWIKRTGAGVTS